MSILLYAPSGIAIQSLCRVFEHSGLGHEVVQTCDSLLAAARASQYSAVVVINTQPLPSLLELYDKWKALKRNSAFIVVSSRQSAIDRVRALQVGITSYHITPFSYTQLVSDVVRHEYLHDSGAQVIEAHGLAIDLISRVATYKGAYLRLTKRQFDLLTMLVRNPGHVFSRVQIWESLWSEGDYPLANTIDVHLNRLRKVLPKEAATLVQTVYGFGYRLKPR